MIKNCSASAKVFFSSKLIRIAVSDNLAGTPIEPNVLLAIFFLLEQALSCGSGSELNLHPNPVTHTQMLLIAQLHFKYHLKGDWERGEKTTTNLHFSSTALAGGGLMNNSMIH